MPEVPQRALDAIEALGADPTPEEIMAATLQFETRDVAVAGATIASNVEGGSGSVVTRPAILLTTKVSGTNGGTPVATSWNTRELTSESDPDAIVTVAANQFTLEAGTYLIEAWSAVWGVNHHKAKIRDVTNGADALMGLSGYSTGDGLARVTGRLVVAATTTYSLQHYTEASGGDYSLGQATSQGLEVYAAIVITKEDV